MEGFSIMNLLSWLVPAGSFGSVVVWYASRATRQIRQVKESHDAYKAMYEDLKNTMLDEIEEKKTLRKAIGRLERAVNKSKDCRYSLDCPVEHELRKPEADQDGQPKGNPRQRGGQRTADNESGAGSGG